MLRRGRWRLLASIGTVVVSVAAVVFFAATSDGNVTRTLDLHDSGVWVTNDRDGLFGRLNKSAEALDSVFMPPGGAQASYDLDIRQDRSVVVAWDRSGGRLLPVDVSLGVARTDGAVAISPDGIVDLRGGSLAVLDVKSGKIRATRYAPDATTASLAVLDTTMPSLAELGASSPAATAGSAAAVGGSMAMSLGVDGSIHAVSSSGKVVTVPTVGAGFGEAVIGAAPAGSKDLAITSVGTRTVVLDRASGSLSFGDRSASLPQATPETFLQAPGPDRSSVIVVTPKALIAAPLNGDPLVTLFEGGTGTPAAPVVLGDCVYAAWAGTPGAVVRSCGGQKATPVTVDRAGALSRPVFRVNRDHMVLNDSATGRLFDVDSSRSLDNWDQLKPQVKDDQGDKAPQSQNPLTSQDPKPKASPDRLGARPGRSTVLHVLDNDSDPAGRVLAITAISDPGVPGASATISPDRQTILVTLPRSSPDLAMTYTVDNGTGNTAQATLSVESRQLTDNKKPELRAGFTERVPTVSHRVGADRRRLAGLRR